MAKIAFILLCHKDPDAIIRQAQSLTAVGDYIAIHFDARASDADYRRIREGLKDNDNVTFPRRRVKCGWGEWSLVDATLRTCRAALDAFPRASHFYMVSGDCMAIKSAQYAHDFLDRRDCDYIESFDFFQSKWIKTGWREERLIYRHFLNERKHKRLFYASYEVQKRLGLQRSAPADIQVMVGSQWWCLRRRTVEWVLDLAKRRRDVVRFFRTTWIPDETFFQTAVRHLVPAHEIDCRTLTFLMFSDYGMPVTLYNDHYDLLVAQDFLFARKISPDAHELKRRLGVLYSAEGVRFRISNEGRALYSFLTERGREGRRFAPRFWEKESSLGRDRELLIVICKKWHVAKRLVDGIRQIVDAPCIDYLFNEESCPLPDLGGIQSSMSKRHRHRRALMRMLYDYYDTDRMVICMDPASLDLLEDFGKDRATVRMLEIECSMTDDYLVGHAIRSGLAGDRTPRDTIDRLLPSVRNDVLHESDRIRDAHFENFLRIREADPPEVSARALSVFLNIPQAEAETLARTEHLFSD